MNPKIWIVEGLGEYEVSWIESVYSTKEKANQSASTLNNTDDDPFPLFVVSEYEVQ